MKSVKLFEKYKNTRNHLNYLRGFCILQLYLIENNLRSIAQIDFREESKYHITRLYTFLHENHIPFVVNQFGIIISNDKKNLKELKDYIQTDDFVGLSKKLGPFYKCSSNTYHKNHYRIVILAIIDGAVFEIFAQMCKKDTLEKNVKYIYKIYNNVSLLFSKLDKNIFVKMETYKSS